MHLSGAWCLLWGPRCYLKAKYEPCYLQGDMSDMPFNGKTAFNSNREREQNMVFSERHQASPIYSGRVQPVRNKTHTQQQCNRKTVTAKCRLDEDQISHR